MNDNLLLASNDASLLYPTASHQKNDDDNLSYEELLAQITHHNKLAFLTAFQSLYYEHLACKQIDINYSTLWRWLQSDTVFRTALQILKKQVSLVKIARLEKELERRALDPDIYGSTTALIFALKSEWPQKYREDQPISTHIGSISIKLGMPDYIDKTSETVKVLDVKPSGYTKRGRK